MLVLSRELRWLSRKPQPRCQNYRVHCTASVHHSGSSTLGSSTSPHLTCETRQGLHEHSSTRAQLDLSRRLLCAQNAAEFGRCLPTYIGTWWLRQPHISASDDIYNPLGLYWK